MAKLTNDEIREILTEYQNGAGTTILGLKFGVDHSSIYYYIKKHSVVRVVKSVPQRIDPYLRAQLRAAHPPERKPMRGKREMPPSVPRETAPKPYHLAILDEPVRPAKSYAQLLAESKERERRRRFPQLYENRLAGAV